MPSSTPAPHDGASPPDPTRPNQPDQPADDRSVRPGVRELLAASAAAAAMCTPPPVPEPLAPRVADRRRSAA